MTPDDPITVWLDYLKPFSTGLVVAPNVLRDLGLVAPPQRATDTADASAVIEEDGEKPALPDDWAFFAEVLGWPSRHVAGSPGGPDVPERLHVRLPEYGTTLAPTWAVRDTNVRDREAYQLLVCRLEPGIDPDGRGALAGWEATPHQRLERLLRETEVPAGLLISDTLIRLVYAPKGETSGWLGFPIRSLATIQGRPMLGGLKLVLDDSALFTNDDARRLPGLLKASRDAQANVSTELAAQVLGALHDLLRGFDAADPDLVRGLVRDRPEHLYEGLLTVLMRLVFVLYAEDRDLLPSRTDPVARELYEQSYSMRGLYHRLLEDAALNPDTMDERRGGWGRMLALFRMVHGGHASGFIRPKRGKLFDPDAFLFLEGRSAVADRARVLPISDGSVLRILEGLMTLQARGGARERISYRALDVEQIGSVYETVMGFTAVAASGPVLAIKGGKNNRTPIYLDLAELAALKGDARIKVLKDAGRSTLSARQSKAIKDAKAVTDLAAALDSIVDERGSPKRVLQMLATPLLQPTDERRRTGSHYTPRSLTEPIVRHALEPAFDRIGEDATAEEVLALKICDPAMGSGAFLVEACRQLGSRLVQAWSRHGIAPKLPHDEDIDLYARRLVAAQCLYGVDRNPMAVDLARLSLWLVTLAREHEFNFFDHALKSGDSLVGLTLREIQCIHWDDSKPGLPLFHDQIKQAVARALKERDVIRTAGDDVSLATQTLRHRRVEEELELSRIVGDAVVVSFFSGDKPKTRELNRSRIENRLAYESTPNWIQIKASNTDFFGRMSWQPFHWEIEFPEVFDTTSNAGFDAIVGNPPFLGGSRISSTNGASYLDWLLYRHEATHGNADLVAHFFRRAYFLLKNGCTAGLISTNTIAQGDTRSSGLTYILQKCSGSISRVIKRLPWPGSAAVVVSIVHVHKGQHASPTIDGKIVNRISAYLTSGDFDLDPYRLQDNKRRAFRGSDIYGSGLTFEDAATPSGNASTIDMMQEIITEEENSREVLYPFLGGDEVNSHPEHRPYRWVIDFGDNTEEYSRQRWPRLMDLVETKVRPEREAQKREARKRLWWQFGDRQPGLYNAVANIDRVIVASQTSKHICFAMLPSDIRYSHKLIVFALSDYASFALLQSRVHMLWALTFGSSMKDDPVYTPSDCFETFPFPDAYEARPDLETSGLEYYKCRSELMVNANEGMTKTYNRFHDPEERRDTIAHLRELHDTMDRAVLRAYGWDDLAGMLQSVFLTPECEDDHTYQGRYFWPAEQRDMVFSRLLALNAKRSVIVTAGCSGLRSNLEPKFTVENAALTSVSKAE